MSATAISRVPLVRTEDVELKSRLFEESRQLLRYDAEHVLTFGLLSQTLMKLGIEPLNRREVEAYKAKLRGRSLSNHAWIWILSSLWLVAASYLGWASHRAVPNSGWEITAAVLSILCVVGYLITIGPYRADVDKTWKEWNWHAEPLANYGYRVPEFALSKAVKIARELPDARFHVEALFEREGREVRRDPDPFLVVKHGRELFYIDVWDEREFEQKLK